MPVDPTFLAAGPEWQIPALAGPTAAPPRTSFGEMLGEQVQGLVGTQQEATRAAQSLADGTASDPTTVVMAVERAQLAMQLASQLRTRGVEAIQEVMRTQV